MRGYQCRSTVRAAAALLIAIASSANLASAAERTVDQHRDADPKGQVEITNVSGRVEVIGWDKPEVAVAGTLGANVDRLDFGGSAGHTGIRVVLADSIAGRWSLSRRSPNDAELVVHVPGGSSLTASLVSADITVSDLQGEQAVQTVSGDITSSAAAAVRMHTVSGDVHLTAGPQSSLLEISTVSGDIEVKGGHGEVSVTTVSGSGSLSLGAVDNAHFKSVSGDYDLKADLTPSGRLEAESVSGGFELQFPAAVPPAEFELQSISGDLKTCFGPKPEQDRYGAGSRFSYREGAGTARVHIDTKSGDVKLCAQQLSSHAAAASH